MAKWTFLGEGAYNRVYRSGDGGRVLKIQKIFKDRSDNTDTPERSVRLWNELNPHLRPRAYITNSIHGRGWVCPYVKGVQASDEEISTALIDIFNFSGRIVVDATAAKNFIRTETGQTVCVDIGLALQMEQREETHFAKGITRKKSITSLDAWTDLQRLIIPDFPEHSEIFPDTIDTIKALLFISSNRPDIFDVNFLKRDPSLITQLAMAFDLEEVPDALEHLDRAAAEPHEPSVSPMEVKDARDTLRIERPINLDNIIESCVNQLENYIISRGTINLDNTFESSSTTFFFRDQIMTAHKIEKVRQLIGRFYDAESYADLRIAIARAQADTQLSQSYFSSSLVTSLGKCMLIVETAEREEIDLKLKSSLS